MFNEISEVSAVNPQIILKLPIVMRSESERTYYQNLFIASQRRLKSFSLRYGIAEYAARPLVENAVIYDDLTSFKKAFKESLYENWPCEKLNFKVKPFLMTNSIICPSIEMYCAHNSPVAAAEYEKIIACELARRLYLRIAPYSHQQRWLFEGFAVVAAGHYDSQCGERTERQIWGLLKETPSNCTTDDCAAIMLYLMKKISMNEILTLAQNDCKDIVRELESIICQQAI